MALFTENSRSKFESAAYTALLLAFFFAVGLAGGVLYRLLPTTNGTEVSSPASPTPLAAPIAGPNTPTGKPVASAAAPSPPLAPAAAPAPAAGAAKTPAAPAKVASVAPAKPATPVGAPPAAAPTSAPLPSVATPAAAPAATLPAAVAPIASEPQTTATSADTTSDRVAATIPPPAKPAMAQDSATHPVAAAKPSAASAKPKTAAAPAPEKRVAAAAPPAPPLSPEGATGPVRVQFGAYAIEDNAHQTQWAVEATGLPVEITQMTTAKGRVLYYVRSQRFTDRAAAVSAATAAQDKAKSFVNPVAIDYVIVSDAAKPAQQAQAVTH